MLFSEWYNNQCIHKNWQSYNQIDRGTICAKELPFRVQPFRGVNCGLIPEEMVPNRNESEPRPRNRRLTPLNSLIEFASKDMNFYSEASNIVKLVKIKQGSVKNLVFSSDQQVYTILMKYRLIIRA